MENQEDTVWADEELFPTYKRWDVTFAKAEDTTITDTNGKTYQDFMAGIGVVNLGHSHPYVVQAVEKQLHEGWHASNFFHYNQQQEAAHLLTSHSCGDLVFFANSGAEANEAAIKLARKHTGRKKIISFVQSFHGRTFGSMAATGQTAVQEGFGPMPEGFVRLPFNDVSELEKAIDEDTAAVLIEMVQGEGGVRPADQAFVTAVEEKVKKSGGLLVCDEIQTGIGRTGTLFAHEQYEIEPDIITSAKGLGNGFPVGAMIGKQFLKESFGPGSHGTTFGGNPLAMAAVKATLQTLFEEKWIKAAAAKGERFLNELDQELRSLPVVKDVRGMGMMAGVELTESSAPVIKELRDKGMLVIGAGPNVIRMLPPLTMKEETLLEGVQDIKEALSSIQS
ncbi:acetylornithine transaminase [Salibacterium qingdaonense]|uniref:Acetylornithine aminotransferase n=1 Tax=Salibacterium qingdaonense TaxID=266892 RepID=A0A1I4IH67_9BACI|nr:acetylornithine transaminase [Salibacterium qingdaonense]SFL53712.1 acetylornithine aminotransferase apoenzyme [Salibacterium qingdaonense]